MFISTFINWSDRCSFLFLFFGKKKLILTSGLLYFAAPIKGITEIA